MLETKMNKRGEEHVSITELMKLILVLMIIVGLLWPLTNWIIGFFVPDEESVSSLQRLGIDIKDLQNQLKNENDVKTITGPFYLKGGYAIAKYNYDGKSPIPKKCQHSSCACIVKKDADPFNAYNCESFDNTVFETVGISTLVTDVSKTFTVRISVKKQKDNFLVGFAEIG